MTQVVGELRFTAPALEQALMGKRVVQTIRSKSELFKNKWSMGQTVVILFKGRRIGEAKISLIEPIPIGRLTEEDARLGGFHKLDDLKRVLARFFRFASDIEPIEVYKVRYIWKR